MKNLLLCLFGLCLIACGDSGDNASSTAGTGDFSAYTLTDIPGSAMKIARKLDESGLLREEGYVLNNQKTGAWTNYYSDQKIKSVANYANGMRNGIMIQFSDRNQVTDQMSYLNDQLHGRKVKYGFNRKIEEETNYANGKLDGVFKSYNKAGDLQREIHYKAGQLHGPNVFFTDGVKTMEYEYKDGEKISGGIVK